ncbi:MAG: hypothetical protein M3323_07510 [Actinomycetota bacterium]|nr:hypothetical protein [Actinomycetota bacterium]
MQEVLRKASTPLVALLLAATLFAAYQVGNVADATHQPADKPFAAASKTVRFSPGANQTLLTATVKNSKPTDLILQVAMECSIITDNVIAGSTAPGGSESATTTGTVRVWLEVDGQIVPIISSSAPPQNPPPPGDDTDKVTFCNRVFNRTVQDAEDPQDGWDRSRDFIATKTANAFNWVRLNMGSGVHTIVVKGELTHSFSPGSSASAFVGNRSLVGIPGKFSNDATINENGTG